jgi:hypothetical protein
MVLSRLCSSLQAVRLSHSLQLALRLTKLLAFGLLPGGSYTLIERFIFRSNTAVQGAR